MKCTATRESLRYAVKLGLSVFGRGQNINKLLRHKSLLLKVVKPSPPTESLVETFDTPTSGQIVVLDLFPVRENITFMTARRERDD